MIINNLINDTYSQHFLTPSYMHRTVPHENSKQRGAAWCSIYRSVTSPMWLFTFQWSKIKSVLSLATFEMFHISMCLMATISDRTHYRTGSYRKKVLTENPSITWGLSSWKFTPWICAVWIHYCCLSVDSEFHEQCLLHDSCFINKHEHEERKRS